MENPRFLALIPTIPLLVVLVPVFVFAYSEKTTHPALTHEIVKLYNHRFPGRQLSDDEMRAVTQGSVDEDNGTRWLQHFYDPIKNRGLVLLESDPQYREIAGIGFAPHFEWKSSKEWAKSPALQSGKLFAGVLSPYFSSRDDFSWDRAIYEYAWGDKERGLLALGHTLHLLEDATVPDHTRNDPHPPILDLGSPYESWAKRFTPTTPYDDLVNKNHQVIYMSDLDEYFNQIATYSNQNFFSKDTLCENTYKNPISDFEGNEVLSDGKTYHFLYKSEGDGRYRLAARSADSEWILIKNPAKCPLFLDDNDSLILADYWTRLSKQAVLHGAGVVKLFFDEVEKERQAKTLYNKNRSWLGKMLDAASERVFNIASVLYGITTPFDLETLDEVPEAPPPTPPRVNTAPQREAAAIESSLQNPVQRPENDSAPVPTEQPSSTQPTPESRELPNPGAGTPSSPRQPLGSEPTPAGEASSQAAIAPPEPPPVAPAPVIRRGPEPVSDATPPDISLSVSQCADSLVSGGCLVATTTLTVNWPSTASDLDHYVVECLKNNTTCAGFSYSPAATSTTFTADDGASYTFRAKAVDRAGNESPYASRTVEVQTTPVVINEIAWAGTTAEHTADEWIELKNRSSRPISLAGWTLYSTTDDKPNLALSGAIAAGGYYLIERTDDTTIQNVSADLTAPFGSGSGMGLGDGGETLALAYGSTTVDQTPAPSCSVTGWCGGSTFGRRSMERIDPDLPGAEPASWGSNDGLIRNGLAADGLSAINGTPKARNSRNYYVSPNGILATNRTLTATGSPYFIGRDDLVINAGVTLTIEPGVVVKLENGSTDVTVNGTLKAVGAAGSEIVFTAFTDDAYGGDTNGDGAASEPVPGSWRTIVFSQSSEASELSYARVRYGGKWFSGQTAGRALVKVDSTSLTVANSVFEESLQSGLQLINSTSTITGSTFQSNNEDALSFGLYLQGGASTVRSNTFTGNTIGIRVEGDGTPTISESTLTTNTAAAISVISSTPIFSSNTARGNGVNGVVTNGLLGADYTFDSNLPYVIDTSVQLLPGKTFGVQPGTVFKGLARSAYLEVGGTFNLVGSEASPVVFTSLKDDSYGGDTNGDGSSSTPAPGDWLNIHFNQMATSSTVRHAIIRYGGNFWNAALFIDSLGMDVSDTIIEYNDARGIRLSNATSTLSNVTVRGHTTSGPQPVGLLIDQGSRVVMRDSAFRDNATALIADGSTVADGGGNTFSGNTINTIPADLFP